VGRLSLTMPLKRAVLPLLDRTEPLAVEVGGPTRWSSRAGSGTATTPMSPAWSRPWPNPGVTAPPGATILGAVRDRLRRLAALRETGLASVAVLVRDRARAGDLLAAAGRLGMEVDLRPFDGELRDGDLLVSTVPAGAADCYAERAWDSRPTPAAVLDVSTPPGPPPLPKPPPSPAPSSSAASTCSCTRLLARSS